jgi:hypothetical protein
MSAGHQKFSAQTRAAGQLDRPNGERRKNIKGGRLSVVFGKDLLCVMAHDAQAAGTSAGDYARGLALAHYAGKGMDLDALAARAEELRALEAATSAENGPPVPAPAAAV